MSNAINFTKSSIDHLPVPHQYRKYYSDTQVKGLSLAIQPSNAKSFYVVKKISGVTAKIFLGKYPDLSIENARKKAAAMLGQIALGLNPKEDKRRIRSELTFGQLFE